MKSNHTCNGISWGVLLLAACNPSIIEPIGLGPESAGQSGESDVAHSGSAGESSHGGGGSGGAGSGGGPAAVAGQSGGPSTPVSCDGPYAALSDAVALASDHPTCAQDSDCEVFTAGCVPVPAVSCSGFRIVPSAKHDQLVQAREAYESCSGHQCIGGGACLPPTDAWCDAGRCAAGARPTNCQTISAAISARVANEETCSLVVLFHEDEVSHALLCGPRTVLLQGDARASANAVATVAGVPVGEGDLVDATPFSDPAPEDLWVFKQLTGDVGHVSGVSAVNGKTLFWIALEKTGDPANPNAGGLFTGIPQSSVPWDTSNIASKCFNPPAQLRRDWDVRTGPNDDPVAPTAEQAAEQVLTSAVVDGMSAGGLAVIDMQTVLYGIGASTRLHFTDHVVIVSAARPH